MEHKLIFKANGQTFTVFKTQEEIVRLLSVDGVELVSINDSGVDFVTSLNLKDKDLKMTPQRKLVRDKGIETKELADFAGIDRSTLTRWFNKDSKKYYDKVSDLVKRFEERR